MWKYCGNISQLGFFILYIISPFSHFISSIRCFVFVFFFSSSIHVCPYLFISPFFSFFFSLIQEVLSLFFFSSSVSGFYYYYFLLDSRTAVVFVRRVGGRGHLCNFTVRAVFSPQFSSRFGRKKIGGPGRKIFSRVFHPLFFPSFPKQWKILFSTQFSTHCFPSSL